MLIDDKTLKKYTKKIMGFAFSKTRNTYLAEDLAQEIMLQLATSLSKNPNIKQLDSYVYTLCCYTWSKFLRDNKKHWDNCNIDGIASLASDTNIEQETISALLIETMQKEIAYLSQLHRQITIMFYYENKKTDLIANELGIKPSTVRWHLGEIRRKLKEGLEMTHVDLSYNPKKMWCEHNGYANRTDMYGLGGDLLVSNIAIACYGEPLTLSEIARKLGVAAAYIEKHVENLVYMDYLKQISNKYQTNFFIEEPRHQYVKANFQYENIGPYAERLFQALNFRLERFTEIGFIGASIDRDMLLWTMLAMVGFQLSRMALRSIPELSNYVVPKRKDGSAHEVDAGIRNDKYKKTQTEFNQTIIDFTKKSNGHGFKQRNSDLCIGMQAETWLSIKHGVRHRTFTTQTLLQLARIKEIITTKAEPNENDKLIIANMVEEGYVKTKNDQITMLVPFLTADQFEATKPIFREIISELGTDFLLPYFLKFGEKFANEIPTFLDCNIHLSAKYSIFPPFAIVGWIIEKDWLRIPDKEEAKAVCTVIIEH